MQIKFLGNQRFEIKGKEAIVHLDKKISVNGFEFPGAGEFEKNGIFIEGIATNGDVINLVRLEEMKLCYLGSLSNELSDNEIKEIGDVDILFLPLGEEGSIDIKKGLKVLSKIDPCIVIPMLYSSLDEFKKSEGIHDGEIDVLKIKKDELPVDERRNVILTV